MSRSSLSYGRGDTAGHDFISAPTEAWTGTEVNKGSIYCHGSGGTALKTVSGDEYPMIDGMSQTRVVMSGNWGGEAWGNDLAVNKVHEGLMYLRNQFNCTGPFLIVCASMGFLTASNYARTYPENVSGIAGIVPCVDINSINIQSGIGGNPVINAAYPPAYRDTVEGLTRSPIHMAEAGLLPDIPIKLWSLPGDTLTPPSTHYAFVEARPGTEMTDITEPGVYHGGVAIRAAAPSVLAWIKEKNL